MRRVTLQLETVEWQEGIRILYEHTTAIFRAESMRQYFLI